MRKIVLVPKGLPRQLTPGELVGWRDKMGWSQPQAAAWLKVPVSSYRNWEQGHRVAHNPEPIRARMYQARPARSTEKGAKLL